MAPSIAAWLRETRLRQRTPEGRPWSQEYTVDRINEWAAGTGWKLYRPNYVGWEGGKQPQPETLARLTAFWAAQGEGGPDAMPDPDPEPLSLEERAVIATERQAAAAERQAAALEALVLASHRGQMPPEVDARLEAFVSAVALARSESPRLDVRPPA